MAESAARSVYFNSIEIGNIRVFGEPQTLNLTLDGKQPARWTLVIGENGVGKTTLLQCLAWMRLWPVEFDPGLFNEENKILERLLPVDGSGDLTFNASLSIGAGLLPINPDVPRIPSRRRSVETRLSIQFDSEGEIIGHTHSRKPERTFEPSLVVAYGANRQQGFSNLN